MKKILFFKCIITTLLITVTHKSISQEKIAKSITEYNSLIKNANPGDVIILKNGDLETVAIFMDSKQRVEVQVDDLSIEVLN